MELLWKRYGVKGKLITTCLSSAALDEIHTKEVIAISGFNLIGVPVREL